MKAPCRSEKMPGVAGDESVCPAVERNVENQIVVCVRAERAMSEGDIDRIGDGLQRIENLFGFGARSAGCGQLIGAQSNVAILPGEFQVHENGQLATECEAKRLRRSTFSGAQSGDEHRGAQNGSLGMMVSRKMPWVMLFLALLVERNGEEKQTGNEILNG